MAKHRRGMKETPVDYGVLLVAASVIAGALFLVSRVWRAS